MKDAFYFSHDSNARHDLKIQALRSVYGMKGYGMYWVIVEMMRESKDYSLPFNQKFAYLGIAKELECTVDEAKQFISDCIYEFGLFVCDEFSFWSDSLQRRMDIYNVKRDSNRVNGTKGGRPPKQKEDTTESKFDASKDIKIEPANEVEIKENKVLYSEDVVEMTILLCNKLRENNEKAKIPADLKKWNSAIDALNRLDGYSFEQIEKVILYSQENHFWKSNILSADKLRKQFATLLMQSQNVKTFQKKNEPESVMDTYNRLLKYVRGEEDDERGNVEAVNIDSSII